MSHYSRGGGGAYPAQEGGVLQAATQQVGKEGRRKVCGHVLVVEGQAEQEGSQVHPIGRHCCCCSRLHHTSCSMSLEALPGTSTARAEDFGALSLRVIMHSLARLRNHASQAGCMV